MVRLADLVEDFSIYPRKEVDSVNLRNILMAIQRGDAIPPIIACEQTLRITDGFHRRRAWMKLHKDDPDYRVEVELRHYDTEGALLADAVRLNIGRGLDLGEYDRRKVVFRLSELGVDDGTISEVLRVPEPRLTQIRLRVATVVNNAGEAVRIEPLKVSVGHFMGKEMTLPQARAHDSAPGTRYPLLIRQLRQAMREGLLDTANGALITDLQGLASDLSEFLGSVPSE
jgi:hypothetical protein